MVPIPEMVLVRIRLSIWLKLSDPLVLRYPSEMSEAVMVPAVSLPLREPTLSVPGDW